MDFDNANRIALSDMKGKGAGVCRLVQGVLLESKYWNLGYICDKPQKDGTHFYLYLIDNDTDQITFTKQ